MQTQTHVPLVFIHGFAGRPQMWAPVLGHLGDAGPRAQCIELPGHGPTPQIPNGDFLETVDAVAAQLAPLGRCRVVGYSMGSRVALWLALRHPTQVASALLISVNPGLINDKARAERVQWDNAQAQSILDNGIAAFMDRWQDLPLFESQKRLSAATLEAQRTQREQHTVEGLAWAMKTLGLGQMPSAWDALNTTHVPLSLLCGETDTKFKEIAQRMIGAIPHISMTCAPSAGHNVPLEAPALVANEVLTLHD